MIIWQKQRSQRIMFFKHRIVCRNLYEKSLRLKRPSTLVTVHLRIPDCCYTVTKDEHLQLNYNQTLTASCSCERQEAEIQCHIVSDIVKPWFHKTISSGLISSSKSWRTEGRLHALSIHHSSGKAGDDVTRQRGQPQVLRLCSRSPSPSAGWVYASSFPLPCDLHRPPPTRCWSLVLWGENTVAGNEDLLVVWINESKAVLVKDEQMSKARALEKQRTCNFKHGCV